ncbi:M14 family zinc carboxypeptidase [Lysobacter yangpyeongensis]|uniref:M14 family zinc carboxypeptidase n=1 Tax=Lysobacter yangpyeongensis TaxID=346182 RepID=A0ABW0SKU4_9GAMM
MRSRPVLFALLLLAASGTCAAGNDTDPLVVIRVSYRDRAELQRIASRFQHLIINQRAKTATVEASHDDIAALQRAGIAVRVDREATARLRESETALQAAAEAAGEPGTQTISGYSCYRTVEETYAAMDALAAAHPNLARVVDIGPSWLRSRNASAGYRMRVLRLNNVATDASIHNKPNMVVLGSIHAREYTPAELLTRFGEWLVNGYGTDSEATWLLDNFRFHIVLQANPDGRKKAEAGLSWRKNVDDLNGTCSANAYGVDLNRNFPYRWNSASGGSSGDPCLGNYRGPGAASEPESIAMFQYIAGTPGVSGVYAGGVLPDRRGDASTSLAPSDYRGLFIDLHSYARLVLWPWSYSTAAPPNAAALRTLGRRLAWFNGYSPRQWTGLYVADGTTTDSVYGVLGAPSYALEMGAAFFESCATFESTTLPQNLAALRYAARTLVAPYVYAGGPDVTAIGASPARVAAGTPIALTATIDDTRYNQSNGTEPMQRITSARAYLDQRPWTSGATAWAMVATDDAFNASREAVRATLSTGGLAPGRHTVLVRGTDASGRPGPPQGVVFTVAGSRTFANGTDVAIPDGGTASSSIQATGVYGTAPTALGVSVDIRHPNKGDLLVDLIAPGGTTYRLHNRSGGTGDNVVASYSRDASSESANGTWRLRVTDRASGSAGFINQWSLVFRY